MICRTCLSRHADGDDGYCPKCRESLAQSSLSSPKIEARCAVCQNVFQAPAEHAGRACICSTCQGEQRLPATLPPVRFASRCACGGTSFARTLAIAPRTTSGGSTLGRVSLQRGFDVQRMAGVPLEWRACTRCGTVTLHALADVPVGTEHGTEPAGDSGGPFR